jgi:hypothetical protein
MIFYWTYLTLAGTLLTGLAILVLMIPPTHHPRSPDLLWWACGAVVSSAGYCAWAVRHGDALEPVINRPVD